MEDVLENLYVTPQKKFFISFHFGLICNVTDSCTDHSHGSTEPTSSVPVTHTFGLHEMAVTRSLLSIGRPSPRPLIWLAACGDGPWCEMKQVKRDHNSLFSGFIAVFFPHPSFLCVLGWRKVLTLYFLCFSVSMDLWTPRGQHVIHCKWKWKWKARIQKLNWLKPLPLTLTLVLKMKMCWCKYVAGLEPLGCFLSGQRVFQMLVKNACDSNSFGECV